MIKKNYLILNHSVKFYVPSTLYSRYVGAIEHAKRTNLVAKKFTRLFGGATITQAKGFWKSEQNKTYIVEDITQVISYCSDEQLKNNFSKIIKFTEKKRKEWQQESIAIEIDNKLYLI